MNTKTIFIACCLFTIATLRLTAQIDLGITGLYNFQSGGIGGDARLLVPIGNSFFIIPRAAYYPSFNNTHEYYAGIEASKFLINYKGLNPYLFVGGYYNNWMNNEEFRQPNATKNNLTVEPGLGILLYKGCLNPYIEGRYSSKWKEFTVGVGLLLHFGDCFGGGGKSRSPWTCPAFN